MAMASSMVDKISCSICLEVFKDPRTLPCGHTFCHCCLKDHIVTTATTWSFTCPYCMKPVKVPNRQKSNLWWAEQFKTTVALVDAIDAVQQLSSQSGPHVAREKNKDKLVIKSSCNCIVSESQLLEEELEGKIEQLKSNVDISVAQASDAIHRQAEKLISKYTAVVRAEEREKKGELDEIHKSTSRQILSMFDDRKLVLEEAKKCIKFGEKLLKSGSVSEIKTNIPYFLKVQTNVTDCLINPQHEIPDVKIEFVSSKKSETKPLRPELGTIHVKNVEMLNSVNLTENDIEADVITQSQSTTTNRKSGQLMFDQSFSSVITSDNIAPFVRSILVLAFEDISQIILADWNNDSVKTFSEKTHKLQNVFKTNTGPCGITKSNDNLVLVTLPLKRQILYLSTIRDIQLIKTISTPKRYNFVSVLQDNSIAVSGGMRGCVDILDQMGHVIRSISDNLVVSPGCLTAIGDSLIVVSDRDNTLTSVSSSGNVNWVSRHSARLCDVTCDAQGFIYVCIAKKNVIIQLSRDGELLSDVISIQDGMSKPRAVCCHEDKLYVAQDDGQIKIFSWN